MITATTSSDSTTMTGVMAKITISGASTVFRPPAPTCSSQPHRLLMIDHESIIPRTHTSAASQYR